MKILRILAVILLAGSFGAAGTAFAGQRNHDGPQTVTVAHSATVLPSGIHP